MLLDILKSCSRHYFIIRKISSSNGANSCKRMGKFRLGMMPIYAFTSDLVRCYSEATGRSTSLRRRASLYLPSVWKEAQLSRIHYYAKIHSTRQFSTNSNNDSDETVKVKRIYMRSPLKWFDIKVKMFLLRSYFDQEFEESEFLQGAKQAICVVTRFISEENFKGLTGMVSDKATEDSMELCKNVSDRTKLKVTDEEIDNISISNLGFVYDGKGRKWADILVTCHCVDDESIAKKIANGEIIGIPSQRIFNISFVREFTPGVAANWIIDRITFNQTFSDAF